MKNYSLKKVTNLYYSHVKWYEKHKEEFSTTVQGNIEELFLKMEGALLNKNRADANELLEKIENLAQFDEKKRFWELPLEFILALAFALIVATAIRQMVFEPYEIPSGSMRPTFKEHDHLVVSKTTFGLNIPLTSGHFYFDEELVKRGGVFIFSGQGVDLPDVQDRYFWVFPAWKRYIKRNMAKPGDTIYFYGGMIYGFDKEGNDLKMLREAPFTYPLVHVPFLNFEGRMDRGPSQKPGFALETIYKHINQAIGRLSFAASGQLVGEIFNGKSWVKDNPLAAKEPHNTIKTYSDYIGIGNFAMVRIVTNDQLKKAPDSTAPLYLQIAHHPYLPKESFDHLGRPLRHSPDQLAYHTTLLPLDQPLIEKLMEGLYTARFTVVNGKAHGIGRGDVPAEYAVTFPGVPDGTYEFYYGKGYKVGFGAVLSPLPQDHPLYSRTPEMVQKLFNFGIDVASHYSPSKNNEGHFPMRYAFYRDGTLWVMNHPLLEKDSKELTEFVEKEIQKGENSPLYIPFIDQGAPLLADGSLDKEKIKNQGFTLPEKKYLALGDNFAMSGDSRTFGPVDEGNLEGTPIFILWPLQDRAGTINSEYYKGFSPVSLIIWPILIGIISFIWYNDRRKKQLPIFKRN